MREGPPGMVKAMQKLTSKEQEAVAWARQGYCHWRKRFSETRNEHMANRPAHTPEDRWQYWYDHPFGRPDWNEYVKTLHRLFATGALK